MKKFPVKKKLLIISLITAGLLLILKIFFIHLCDFVPGKGIGVFKKCECQGLKAAARDDRHIGGDFKTMCLGIVKSSLCFEREKDNVLTRECSWRKLFCCF